MWRGVIVLALTVAIGCHAQAAPHVEAVTAEPCFTPHQRCTGIIVAAIDHARREIWVLAYGFTSEPIVTALVAAHRRGVKVAAILDKSNGRRSKRYSGARTISAAGVPVWIDHHSGIAHNKVIVIDGRLVITGSFNFTTAADRRNAENVLVIESTTIAAQYLGNWRSLLTRAQRYEEPERLRYPLLDRK